MGEVQGIRTTPTQQVWETTRGHEPRNVGTSGWQPGRKQARRMFRTHRTVHPKRMDFITCKLYLSKLDFKKT